MFHTLKSIAFHMACTFSASLQRSSGCEYLHQSMYLKITFTANQPSHPCTTVPYPFSHPSALPSTQKAL